MARTMILFSFIYVYQGQIILREIMCPCLYLNANVLQRLLKCRFLLYKPNNSFGDNAIDKPRYLACIQHKNQNGTFKKTGYN